MASKRTVDLYNNGSLAATSTDLQASVAASVESLIVGRVTATGDVFRLQL